MIGRPDVENRYSQSGFQFAKAISSDGVPLRCEKKRKNLPHTNMHHALWSEDGRDFVRP